MASAGTLVPWALSVKSFTTSPEDRTARLILLSKYLWKQQSKRGFGNEPAFLNVCCNHPLFIPLKETDPEVFCEL